MRSRGAPSGPGPGWRRGWPAAPTAASPPRRRRPPLPERRDVRFTSAGDELSGWHLPGEGDAFSAGGGRPCVVMATGMGATKDSSLLPFAEAFSAAGMDALLFDYRGFGTSGGEPRQLAWPPRHRQDLGAAVGFARGLEGVDPDRTVLWGWSWGSSHCLYVAGEDPDPVAALIAMGPAVDGLATIRHLAANTSLGHILRLNALALRDVVRERRGEPRQPVPMAGPPGSFAVLTTPQSEPGYKAIAGPSWRNEVLSKVAHAEWVNRAITRAERLGCPILIQACDEDEVVSPDTPRKLAWEAKGRSEMREYPGGHFDFLLGLRERVIADQLRFLRRHLGGSGAAARASAEAASTT